MSAPPGYDELRSRVGAVVLARDVVSTVGPDAASFLQGQLSQDIAALGVGSSAWSFLLAPTGKVDAWLRVTRIGDDAFELDVDAGWGAAALARLERFKLRTKCELTHRTERCIAVRGPESDRHRTPAARESGWPGVDGFDLLGGDAEVPGDVPAVSIEAFERLRVESGVPALGAELTEKTIPAEAGAWLIEGSVSFTKGCYTGQELVARIDSRGGNVPRHLRAVLAADDLEVFVGAEVRVDGKVVGEVTSAAGNVGLAFVGRAVEPPASVELVSPIDVVPATVAALPVNAAT